MTYSSMKYINGGLVQVGFSGKQMLRWSQEYKKSCERKREGSRIWLGGRALEHDVPDESPISPTGSSKAKIVH